MRAQVKSDPTYQHQISGDGASDNMLHPWLRKVGVAHVSGPSTPALDAVVAGLLDRFELCEHRVQAVPGPGTDAVFTTARYGEPVDWRDAPMFTARKRFGLEHNPTVFTFLHTTSQTLRCELELIDRALQKDPPSASDFRYPGLASPAPHVLIEQGLRGGPILALLRILQAQTKCFRVVLVVESESSDGDDWPLQAYHFDLVGAHPVSRARTWEALYDDIVMRIATTVSASEVADHEVIGEPVPHALWQSLTTPAEMVRAAREIGSRGFFTEPVQIDRLVRVPVVPGVVASQYSEGCFATWDPVLGALITTVTGSTRPVHKGSISEEDLSVVVGVRPDRLGALVRQVEGRRNDPPSSEALELVDMDSALPTIDFGFWILDFGLGDVDANPKSKIQSPKSTRVPIVRSKLHGHRGVAAYDPRHVEFAPLDPPYYRYLVSCATGAQALGIKRAFARSEALRNPDDPRKIVFTILPGHGVVIVEKWVPGTAPFNTILQAMDAGYLRVESRVPQGPMWYVQDGSMCVLRL